jgi:antiphage defense system Thoeris ThsB-like protein
VRDKVFVSFGYENDRKYKFMLEAWNDNPEFEFTFQDMSSDEINSSDVGRVRAVLTAKINRARYTFVIVGRYANTAHKDRLLIGSRNWINFEIKQSKANYNKLVASSFTRVMNPRTIMPPATAAPRIIAVTSQIIHLSLAIRSRSPTVCQYIDSRV